MTRIFTPRDLGNHPPNRQPKWQRHSENSVVMAHFFLKFSTPLTTYAYSPPA